MPTLLSTATLVGPRARAIVWPHEKAAPYFYFAMALSVFVEILNLRVRSQEPSVKLHQPFVEKPQA
jgi:hypothetical protein